MNRKLLQSQDLVECKGLVIPPFEPQSKIGWPRVGNKVEFRMIAFLNLLGSCASLYHFSILKEKNYNGFAGVMWSSLIHLIFVLWLIFIGFNLHPIAYFVRVIAALQFEFTPCPGHPKKFAQTIVAFLLALQFVFSLILRDDKDLFLYPLPTYLLTFALFFDSVLGICFGCLIYSYLIKWRVVPESWVENYLKTYQKEEILGVYANFIPVLYKKFCIQVLKEEDFEVKTNASSAKGRESSGANLGSAGPSFWEVVCEDGNCIMVERTKSQSKLSPPDNLIEMSNNLPKNKKVKQEKVNKNSYLDPHGFVDNLWKDLVPEKIKNLTKEDYQQLKNRKFLKVTPHAVSMESEVSGALTHWKESNPDISHDDTTQWNEDLFQQWRKRNLYHGKKPEDINIEYYEAEVKEDNRLSKDDVFGSGNVLKFKHPFFAQKLRTRTEHVAFKNGPSRSNIIASEETDDEYPEFPEWKILDGNTEKYIVERAQAYEHFLRNFPEYVDQEKNMKFLRERDYSILDEQKMVYLDYTAGNLPAQSQLDALTLLLRNNVLGNPHSACQASLSASFLDAQARESILSFFNTDPQNYEVIFTLNASNALKIVGESFMFTEDSKFLYTWDNHNSVVGIREWALNKGAKVDSVKIYAPELRVDEKELMEKLQLGKDLKGPNLFAYPAQSNVSGVKHPLEWIKIAELLGWYVCCDAAAFVPTSRLDLNKHRPHFVPMSFYKMFGFPTGIGCLLVRQDVIKDMKKPYFAGGTVRAVTVHDNNGKGRVWLADGHAKFEDGTVNYMNIPAVNIGLKHLSKIGIDNITVRVNCMAGWLIEALLSLKFENGNNLVKIYGPPNTKMRGGTITVNFFNKDGSPIHAHMVEYHANHANVNVRVGCFCNPGCSTVALDLTESWIPEEQWKIGEVTNAIHGSFAMIRISIGIATNFDDIFRFYLFTRKFLETERTEKWHREFWKTKSMPGGLC